MELEIVELAKRMREAYHRIIYGEDMNNILRWDEDYEEERLAWVAAAAVARPDLVAGLSVPEGHWLAPILNQKREPVRASDCYGGCSWSWCEVCRSKP